MESVFWGNRFYGSGAALARMAVISLAVVGVVLGLTADRTMANPPPGYHLAMAEEFNGNSISDTIFRDYWLDGTNTTDAVSVENGYMTITTYSTTEGGQTTHHGAHVVTADTYSYLYGYIEARVKFNNAQGNCMAFWLDADGMFEDPACIARDGMEIDIIEQRHTDENNNSVENMFHIDLWAQGYGDDNYDYSPTPQRTVPNLENTWHTIGCYWDSTGYTFTCDDYEVWSYYPTLLDDLRNKKLITENNEWILFDSKPWGGWCGDLLQSYGSLENSTTKMTVDYCRVYQLRPVAWNHGQGGNGTWNPTAQNWSWTDNTGWFEFQNYDDVYFRGTAGTITISGFTPYVTSLHFESDGHTLTGGSVYLARRDLMVNPGLTATINSEIQGPEGLKLLGEGKLILGGNNTYTGETIVAKGSIINIRSANALGGTGHGTLVDGYASLQIEGGITTANEPLTLEGPGVGWHGALWNVSGNNTYSGLITLGSDDVRIWSQSGTLTLSNNGTITGDGNDLVVLGDGNTIIYSVIGTGSGGLTVNAGGTVTLANHNTYTGMTTVENGTLTYGTNNAIASGPLTVNDGTFALSIFSDTVGAVTLNGGTISGSGYLASTSGFTLTGGSASATLAGGVGLTKSGTGTATLSGSNTYTGTTSVSAGSLNIQHANALGSTGTGTNVASGAALQIQGGITVAAESLTLNGSGVSNTGALRNISGNNTYTGNISLGSAATIASDSNQIYLSNAGTLTGYGCNLTIGGAGNVAVDRNINIGPASVYKTGSGTAIFLHANSYTGTTYVQDGTLIAQGGTALGTTASGTVVSYGATLKVQANMTTAEPITISGSGVADGGALWSSGTNTLTGNLGISGWARITSYSGMLNINGSSLSLSAGTLTFGGNGDTTINSAISGSGTIAKEGSGTLYIVGAGGTGSTTLNGGTIELVSTGAKNRVLSYGCDIQKGRMAFDYPDQSATILSLLDASYEDGYWDEGQFLCSTADNDHGLGWFDDGSTEVVVAYTVYGDADLDGDVDDTDVGIVQGNLNTSGVWADGDFNYDGLVNAADWAIVNANYGMTQSFKLEIDPVPEPSTLILLAVAGIVGTAAYVRRRRARS